MGSEISTKGQRSPSTVTHTEIIYRWRLAVLAHTRRSGVVAETCRTFGVSRTVSTSGGTGPTQPPAWYLSRKP